MSTPLPQTIGIDISKKHLDAHAHPSGDVRQFANTAAGFAALLKWTAQWPVERIAYEATGAYHRAFEQALASLPLASRCEPDASLKPAGHSLRQTGSMPESSPAWQPHSSPMSGLSKARNWRNWQS